MTWRDYDPNSTRFIIPDTYQGEEEKPFSTNKYLYAEGDPINNVDPAGHWVLDIVFLVVDVASLAEAPSLAAVGWVALDVGSLLIPVGSVSALAHGADAVAHGADLSHLAEEAIHGNSKLSSSLQHGYEIYEVETKNVAKTV